MQRLPIGIQTFENLRKEGYLYVDKTADIYRLIHGSGKYFFLSRPRRFGKSLLLTTIKAYFEGKRELFEGLAIAGLEQEWKQHPVLHLDLNTGDYSNEEGVWDVFRRHIEQWEKSYGIVPTMSSLPNRMANIINSLDGVVILVDEYDKPLLQTMNDIEKQERFRTILKSMYSVLKTCDAHIRFALLTGVSRFSHVSIFSDLNNLIDISLDDRYAAICGITETELRDSFVDHIKAMAKKGGIGSEDVLAEAKAMYDGYHFSPSMVDIYNPFSLLSAFDKQRFDAYWYQSGTPTFLVKMLEASGAELPDLDEGRLITDSLSDTDSVGDNWAALFFQTGYLTIKDYDPQFRTYYLGFPNREVAMGFIQSLMPHYVQRDNTKTSSFVRRSVLALQKGDIESFLQLMQSFLADVPYELVRDTENYYQTALYIICRFLGFYTRAEYHTSRGRIDMLMQHGGYTYIFEFKIDGSAEAALAQINDRDYPLPFAVDGKKVMKIGVNFSSEKRNIDEWRVEE